MRTSIIITFFAMYALISCKKETAINIVKETVTNTVNEYKIIISRDDLRKVKVEAELNIPERRLSMDWPAANSVERGWSHFVENLKVYDMEDNLIEIEYVDKATWQLNTTAKRVQISYDVNVMHDTVSWEEGGHSASAYVVEDVVYIIGAALFIASPAEIKRGAGEMANISFSMPYDYDIVVPWKQRGETKHNFSVNSTYDLVRSGISFGDIEKGYLSVEGMEVYIATAKDFKAIIPLFKSIYKEIIPAAQAYFDDQQLQDKYVVIINKAPRTKEFEPYFSGEALHQSMSFITPIFPTEEFMPLFWYILTHEYVHLWNGINIETLHGDKETWFMEGFTDYISLGLLNKLGKISQEQMINSYQVGPYSIGWGDNIKKYLVVAGKLSMREAGKSKADNYDLLYSGGSLFALILDIEMNAITNGKIGVRNLTSEINKKFGNKTAQLDYNDIKDMVSELSGTNFDYLFDAYVEGIEIITVAECLQKAGLLIKHVGQATQKITIDPNATENQKLVLKAVIGID